MNTAAKGRRLEHEVRKIFEAAGYSGFRGAGSKGLIDTPHGPVKADLVMTKCDRQTRIVKIVAMQCKIQK